MDNAPKRKRGKRAENRQAKVLKLHILKPADGRTWNELGDILREIRYRVFRLANLYLSEAYLNFHKYRDGQINKMRSPKISVLNKKLLELLERERKNDDNEQVKKFSKKGALCGTVYTPLEQYKLRALTSGGKWSEVLRGKSSLPSFRLDMAVPVRCDKPNHKKLEKMSNGEVELDLMISTLPYPRITIATKRESMSDGQRAILERLLDPGSGYRQRYFEIKEERRTGKWHLFVTYDFPIAPTPNLSKDRIVGVDLGFSCPIYIALNNGHARLGRRAFGSLGARMRSLQRQVIRRRREIQRGGGELLGTESARSGHGRNRKLKPIENLEGRINSAYSTLNHQLSAAIIKFARDHGAGVIQIEKLDGLKDELAGTFIGQRWRYEELQRFIEYKAREVGIELRKINPQYTSQRCHECGHINAQFTRAFRDDQRRGGMVVKFKCPQCGKEHDPDYNAAKNLATDGIEDLIKKEIEKRDLNRHDL